MKRIFIYVLVGFMSLSTASKLKAQLFDEIIYAGGDDVSTYMGYYVEPFMNGFGTGLANGWYNTAATHKTLGFDLSVYGSLVSVPDEDLFFTFLDSEYNSLSLVSGATSAELPTLLGGTTDEELVSSYTDSGTGITVNSNPFSAPDGIGEDLPSAKVPVPMLQLGIGVPKGTELIIRYVPFPSQDDFSASFFGIGIKHDIKQWIPGIRSAPFDLSVLIGYTNLDINVLLTNSDVVMGSDDREGTFDMSALTFQALASKTLSVLTVYGGVGYNGINSNFSMTGDYILEDATVPGLEVIVSDPVNLDYKLNGLRATVGAQLKLAVFTFSADYTVQKYNTLTLGFGISVR